MSEHNKNHKYKRRRWNVPINQTQCIQIAHAKPHSSLTQHTAHTHGRFNWDCETMRTIQHRLLVYRLISYFTINYTLSAGNGWRRGFNFPINNKRIGIFHRSEHVICATVLAQLAAGTVAVARRPTGAYEGYWHIVYDAHCTSIGIRVKINKNDWSVHRLPCKLQNAIRFECSARAILRTFRNAKSLKIYVNWMWRVESAMHSTTTMTFTCCEPATWDGSECGVSATRARAYRWNSFVRRAARTNVNDVNEFMLKSKNGMSIEHQAIE